MDKFKPIKLFFTKQEEKLNIINNKSYDTSFIAKLINTLNKENKIEVIKNLFVYGNNINYSETDITNIFRYLSYQTKILVLTTLEKKESYQYLKYLNLYECISMVRDGKIHENHRVYIIKNFLPYETKVSLFKYSYLSSEETLAIIKEFDEDYLRYILKRRIGGIKNLSSEAFAIALSYLPSTEEKLSLLKPNNEYKVKLTDNQKIKIIMTTNDNERIKLIKDPKIEKYKKIEIAKTLTDNGKIYFLTNPKEMKEYLDCYTYEFYNSFSANLVRIVLTDLNYYNIEKYYLDNLINQLEPTERIEILYDKNHYNIPIDWLHKGSIVRSLPEEYKLELIKSHNIYNIDLTRNQLVELLQNMHPKNIIKVLIKDAYIELTKEETWKVIESLSKKNAIYFLSNTDPEVISFTEKYKTSFSKCLDTKDKLDIIYNESKYNLHLDDERKLKLLKTLDFRYQKIELKDNVFKYFDNPDKVIEKLISNKQEFNKLEYLIQEQIVKYITSQKDETYDINIFLNILKYLENSKEILDKFDMFKDLFQKININLSDFIQYGINSNKYKWDKIILDILNNDKINEFINIKEYFSNNYYTDSEDKKKSIENFLELLNAYDKYKILCLNLTNEYYLLSKEEKQDIRYLFKSTIENSPTNIKDIQNIRNEQITSYQEIAKNNYNLITLRNSLLKLFFGKNEYELKDILKSTGNTKDLNILKFNNRDNLEYSKVIDNVILMTEFIERIFSTDDVFGLRETLDKYTSEDNLETTRKYINYCSKYEEYIRKLYELDVQVSLTNINNLDVSLKETPLAKKMQEQYGGEVYDLTNSKYILMAHVKSRSESINNLLSGVSDGNSNFICMSPTSHRGQHYYAYTTYSVVFAYDEIPTNSFICSSVDNLGSNHSLNYNTSEVPDFRRVQKGILETSEASSHRNAEMLLYREGLKPCGIIIPYGKKPNDEEIEYHKKYNLPFILTQDIDQTIENPKNIKKTEKNYHIKDLEELEILKELKAPASNKVGRRIAIITDPHALYEPTMACLTDIKNKGIEEIYSLGDNIGHGPSPKETLEILDEYNVKSILGNHELYIIEPNAMDLFKEHLISTGALERTTDMTNWIKQEITKEQYDSIKEYPNKYEITLPNKEKITLIHTTDAYNKEGKYSKEETIKDSTLIIKGHKHFASNNDFEYILRAVGIGQGEKDDGYATYAILNITKDDYYIEIHNVPYNRSNLLHTINESSMPIHAKSLIKSWVGPKTK